MKNEKALKKAYPNHFLLGLDVKNTFNIDGFKWTKDKYIITRQQLFCN